MPNWKKLIHSGSNAVLASLTIPSIYSNGSVTTGTNVVTIDSNGQLYMTGSYSAVPTLQSVTAKGSSTTIPITASILTSPLSNTYQTTAGPLTVKGGNGVFAGGSNGGHLNLQGGDSTHATNGFGGDVVIRGGEGALSSGSISITGDTTITGDTSVTGNITGSNIYATSDIFLGAANSFGIRLNNPNQTEFTIGPYTSTTPYFTVSDSFITIPSSGILLSENTNLALDNSGGTNSGAAVRFLGGASIAGNISTTSITASSGVDIQGVLSLPNIANVSESIRTAGRYQTGDGTNSTQNKLGSSCAAGTYSYVGGGEDNQAKSSHSSVVGGDNNYVLFGACSSIVGGYSNIITKGSTGAGGLYGIIGGGASNSSCAQYGVIGGGCSNHLDNNTCLSSVVGGQDNHIEKDCYSFIGGGQNNCIKDSTSPTFHNVIVGGENNLMRDNCYQDIPNCYTIIGGGRSNEINSSVYSNILGGCGNGLLDRANYSTIVGGYGNKITDQNNSSFIGGGTNNCISGSQTNNSIIGGGQDNVIGNLSGNSANNSKYSIIGGGCTNDLQGQCFSGILGGKNNTSVGCNNNNIFIIGSDICVNKSGTTQNGAGCMTYVNHLCAWGTDGLNGTIRACKITQTGEVAIEFKKMASGDSDPIEVESDLQITTGKAIKGASPITFADTANITASMNSGVFTHPAIIASGSEAMQATGSVGIQGVLSLPNFPDVSASLAAAGGVSAFPFTGDAQITGSLVISASNNTSQSLEVQGSGSTIFSVQGSQGQLFSITDDLLDDNLVVNDISGDVIFKVSGSGLVLIPVGDLTGSATATASYGHFIGDGGGLTNLPPSNPFPFTGDAQITGSLIVSGSAEFRGTEGYDTNVVIGKDATSTGQYSVVIGKDAGISSGGSENVIIGHSANLANNALYNVVIGEGAYGSGNSSVAIGEASTAAGEGIAIGRQANVSGFRGIAIGKGATAGLDQLSIGDSTNGTLISGSLATGHIILSQTSSDGYSQGGLEVHGSGSNVFEVIGSEGTLFSVDDDLDGTIFTANDRSGLPVLEASASGEVYIGKAPQSLYTTAVISSTTAATTQSIFGLSTSSYGGAFFDYTVQSGSDARAGSIMSVWNGGNISFTETTTTDIGDTTDFNVIVHISQSQAQIASHASRAGYNIKTIIRSI